jgi:hypothetical protein
MLKGNQTAWRIMNSDPQINIKWKKKERQMEIGFLFLVLIVAAFTALTTSGGLRASAAVVDLPAIARFTGNVAEVTLTNPNSVDVKFSIKNNGGSTGVPNCTVMVQDPSESFPSFYAPVISGSIRAGHTLSGSMAIAVAGPGPQYVTQGKLSCG